MRTLAYVHKTLKNYYRYHSSKNNKIRDRADSRIQNELTALGNGFLVLKKCFGGRLL